jgi:L-seryl-tRNA(Ser) seleniumtransferase
MTQVDPRRSLPQVEALARRAEGMAAPALVRFAARAVIDEAREAGAPLSGGPDAALEAALVDRVFAISALHRVINATGVLLHTNLGRASLRDLASEMTGASAVEIDLRSGKRGHRLVAIDAQLAALTGSEAALVVNNNAGALLLALSTLAAGGEVLVSRGQLVEIGGSFRIPDVIVQGGARLREVGTTNRTHRADYEQAITDDTRVVLEVHPSNYRTVGFTSSVPSGELADLAHTRGLPLVVDLGSGLLDSRCPWIDDDAPIWLKDEPGARQALAAGADLVTFSGDKLLGGPQAGIICGRSDLLQRMRGHPLTRALRFDKTRAVHLHSTLNAYLNGTVQRDVPFWRMACAPTETLRERAAKIVSCVNRPQQVRVIGVVGTTGAGSLAVDTIPDIAIVIEPNGKAGTFAARLRRGDPPIIARIHEDRLLVHMRAIDSADDNALATALCTALAATS